jgi:hypothetical protein
VPAGMVPAGMVPAGMVPAGMVPAATTVAAMTGRRASRVTARKRPRHRFLDGMSVPSPSRPRA